ncbi:site-specific DNA-methyltransferase [Ensifer sp. MPMI2T]|nr:site-specific DNA-methyltransferase [Ensifer sp. MPMI2T]
MSEPRTFLDGKVTLYGGDNRDVLKLLPDNSIDAIVTDPPYALVSITKRFGKPGSAPAKDVYGRGAAGFMGRTWDTGEVAFSEVFWAECLRVLKPGGHVVAFSGTRTYHRMTVAIEDAGFEIRDQLAWVYGSGFPKSHDVSKAIDKAAGIWRGRAGAVKQETVGQAAKGTEYERTDKGEPATPAPRAWDGWGTALKPAWEPIALARKPLDGTVAENVLEHGTGAINVDGCRVGDEVRMNAPGSTNERVAMGGGWREDAKPTVAVGRWPANIVHDGSDEVVACFPEAAPAKSGMRGNQHSGRHGGLADIGGNIKEGTNTLRGIDDNGGSAARFFYSAKADKQDRIGSKHPTVKPVDLMQWLCRLITPKGGVVLDPFAGSGSTGEAAWREGFSAILIEREEEYQADIAARLNLANAGPVARKARAIKQSASAGPLFGDNDNIPAGGGRQIYGKFADQQPGYRRRDNGR